MAEESEERIAPIKILLVSLEDQIMLMIDTAPSAYMVVLTDEQLEKLGKGCEEMLERRRTKALLESYGAGEELS